MAKISVIIPDRGMDRATLDKREKMLASVLRKETEIFVDCIHTGPESLDSHIDEILAGAPILNAVINAEKNGFDAAVIYCFSDPALTAARQAVKIPVVGAGEAALATTCSLGYKYTVITTSRQNIPRVELKMQMLGLAGRIKHVSSRSLDIPGTELRKDRERTVRRLTEVCKAAIAEDGAHVLVLGCLGLAGYGRSVQNKLNVPVVDPAFNAVCMAEMLATLKLGHSKIAFPPVT